MRTSRMQWALTVMVAVALSGCTSGNRMGSFAKSMWPWSKSKSSTPAPSSTAVASNTKPTLPSKSATPQPMSSAPQWGGSQPAHNPSGSQVASTWPQAHSSPGAYPASPAGYQAPTGAGWDNPAYPSYNPGAATGAASTPNYGQTGWGQSYPQSGATGANPYGATGASSPYGATGASPYGATQQPAASWNNPSYTPPSYTQPSATQPSYGSQPSYGTGAGASYPPQASTGGGYGYDAQQFWGNQNTGAGAATSTGSYPNTSSGAASYPNSGTSAYPPTGDSSNQYPYASTSSSGSVTPAAYMPGSTRSFSDTQSADGYPHTASSLTAPSPTAGMR